MLPFSNHGLVSPKRKPELILLCVLGICEAASRNNHFRMKIIIRYAIDFAESAQQLSPCSEFMYLCKVNKIMMIIFIAAICMKFDLLHKPLLIDSLYFCSKMIFPKTITRPAVTSAAVHHYGERR
jgi:hypothetical protein